MQCPSCRQPNARGANFCEACGAPLPLSCVACGQAIAAVARFCSHCGAATGLVAAAVSLAPTPTLARDTSTPDATSADRRQAVLLFADISGYTAMCARSDPEQIQFMLGGFFDAMDKVVEGYGGRVFDRAGDAVMAVFGAPVAHGNDAQRALRAALAMHVAAASVTDCDSAPLRLHIGLASGEVVAAVITGGGKSKYSVTGAPVNLAARLDTLAAPGETLISDDLHQQVAHSVDAQALGDQVIKGFAAPIAVWRVLGLREALGAQMPFVGRQAELRQLVGALQAVRESGLGTAVLVRGDAGIGKSRLLDELRRHAREQGFDTPAGHVLDFGVGKGRDAVASLLHTVLGVDVMADEAARRTALLAAIDAGLVAEDERLFVNEWLDLPQSATLQAIHTAMDNTTRLRRASDALAAVLRRAAAARPQLVLVEDIHWATPELLRHLAAITREASRAPLVLVLSSRIEGDPIDKGWRASIHGSAFSTLDLAPLRPQEAQRLAGGFIRATSQFAMQCIERAEGNPLFLEQLLRAAQAQHTPGLVPEVPPTIRSLVLERMDRLAPADRAALQAAGVLGKSFSLADLRAVAGTPGADCALLVSADLVRPNGPDYLFAHALIQEAVYASTLKSRRRELHLAAARWFADRDTVLQAEHLDRADDAAAAAAYLRAATQEAARLRFEAALRLTARGGAVATRSLPGDASVGCALALLRGEVLQEIGRSKESIDALQSALGQVTDERQRCRTWMGIAAGHRVTGDFGAAMDALAHAEPIARQLDLAIERSHIHHTRGNLFFAQGRIDECDAQHVMALQFAEQCGNAESQARALSGLGDARYAQGRMRSALEFFRRCVALCEGQIRIAVPNRCMIGHCLWYENQLPAAIAETQAATDDALRAGVVAVQVFALASLTQLLTEAGHHAEGEAAGVQALALARHAGSRRYEALMLYFSAERQLRVGRLGPARADVDQALALAQQTGLGFIGAALHARLARMVDGAAPRAQCLAEGTALLQQTGLAHNALWFYRDAIEASLEAGEWQAALGYADQFERRFQAEPLPWVGLVAERARAIVAARTTLRGADSDATSTRLQHVRAAAAAAGAGWALAGIDAALTTA